MIQTQPLEISDFTGGITDDVLDGKIHQAEKLDNLQYQENGKLRTRWGSKSYVDTYVFSGKNRISALRHVRDPLLLKDTLLAISNGSINYPKEDFTGWEYLLGPNRGSAFDAYTKDSIYSIAEYQDQLFIANDSFCTIQKVYYDENSVLQIRNAGLPTIPATVNISIDPPAGDSATYSYAFIFRYDYNVGDKTYLDRGPIYFYPEIVEGGDITAGTPATITLPTQSLVSPGNWDVNNFKVEIYRTLDGSPDYFLTKTVDYGTPTVEDNVDDETLQGNAALYGNNGLVSNGTPPKAKVISIVNNTGYYAHVKSDEGVDKYIIYQSIPGDPDSVPNNFFENTEQAIVSVSSIYDRPMVLCSGGYIYRVDGFIASDGSGTMSLARLDDTAGCVAHNSVVQTSKGLVWAGLNGFYWSDGFKVMKISGSFNESYKKLVSSIGSAINIQGTYDPSDERVYWSVNGEDQSSDNEMDTLFVLDLRFNFGPEAAFTTWTGGEAFKPSSVLFHNEPDQTVKRLYRGDSRGYVLYHEEGIYTDPDINKDVEDISLWSKQAIVYDYKSTFMDFGTKFLRKWVPRILISADNTTNLTMKIVSNNDQNKVVGELKQLSYQDNIIWGEPLPAWGTDEVIWNKEGLIEQWRRFPAGGLRCQYKQIQFTNGVKEIVSSELLGMVEIDPSLKTATLVSDKEFPPDLGGYYIAFAEDGYRKEYLIYLSNTDTVLFKDVENYQSEQEVRDFKIVGIPKNEILVLNAYVLHFAPLSKTQQQYINPSYSGGK